MSASNSDIPEIWGPPAFDLGQKVKARKHIRNDGTFPGREIGEILIRKGEEGYVAGIGTFLQQFYIYSVDFIEPGCIVGMKGSELVALEPRRDTPEEVEDSFAPSLPATA